MILKIWSLRFKLLFQIAFYWEGNDPKDEGKITYGELHKDVCKFANVLKTKGVQKGNHVATHMPMITEVVMAMLDRLGLQNVELLHIHVQLLLR